MKFDEFLDGEISSRVLSLEGYDEGNVEPNVFFQLDESMPIGSYDTSQIDYPEDPCSDLLKIFCEKLPNPASEPSTNGNPQNKKRARRKNKMSEDVDGQSFNALSSSDELFQEERETVLRNSNKKGEKTKNFLPFLQKKLIKKIKQNSELRDLPSSKRFEQGSANRLLFEDFFSSEQAQPFLCVWFSERQLVRDLIMSSFKQHLKPFYLKKLKVLQKKFYKIKTFKAQ